MQWDQEGWIFALISSVILIFYISKRKYAMVIVDVCNVILNMQVSTFIASISCRLSSIIVTRNKQDKCMRLKYACNTVQPGCISICVEYRNECLWMSDLTIITFWKIKLLLDPALHNI